MVIRLPAATIAHTAFMRVIQVGRFEVPEAAITVGTVGAEHTVNAGDASFEFTASEPVVIRNRIRNADDVNFAFVLPEPAITRSRLRNAGDALFTFAIAQPAVTLTSSHGVDAGGSAFAFTVPTAKCY